MHLCLSLSSTTAGAACSSAMFTQRYYFHFPPFLRSHRFHRRRCFPKFCRVFAPRLSVSSSLSSVLASASGSGSVHGAVTSAITQVAVTAVAIASGACLSTKVDFLWPKGEEQPGSHILGGVDVTGYLIFYDAKVFKAIEFAKKAHHGQIRKTGDPYLTHCIHTGRILATLVPSSGSRAVDTVVAGILHDVVDDTCETLHRVEEEFGGDVAKLVADVSRLSYINQLLRRHRRINVNQGTLNHEEANNLRVMLLGMVDDPRVMLIKLADRLHNMRTIYALPLSKAQAVAQETLVIWCSLASRLGLWALKAEMEDLCFAVMQPQIFQKMRSDLAFMWRLSSKSGSLRRVSAKTNLPPSNDNCSTFHNEGPTTIANEVSGMKIIKLQVIEFQENMLSCDLLKGFNSSMEIRNCSDLQVLEIRSSLSDLLEAVVPFDILVDRRKRTSYLGSFQKGLQTHKKPKVVQDAGTALASLVVCEEALERELIISTSYVPGMEVTLCSRLKSIYSIYSKMKRKEVGIDKVYDARALRVVVGDKNGTLHGPAVQCCYSLLNILHRLWSPIDGEFDDYIVNPKPSGYQSLHTAVLGPDSSPLEVQIRTQRMHEYAEHGLAAHWLYKETGNKQSSVFSKDESRRESSSYLSNGIDDSISLEGDIFQKYSSLKTGHPVLRVEGSNLLGAVIIRVDERGKELLVAVSFGQAASEVVADRRSSFQINPWQAYARLYKKVSDEWWCEPGHGDWRTCLERYIFCRDGIYHKQDQFGRLLPTFIQIIDLTEQEESDYWSVMSAVFEGRQVDLDATRTMLDSVKSTSSEARINNKVQLLRAMLQWEGQLLSEHDANLEQLRQYQVRESYILHRSITLGEVVIVCWPHGEIMRLSSGSSAADAARRVGFEGKLVLVNGHLVLPNTELKDGDVVEVRV